jgi:hypothetical protein
LVGITVLPKGLQTPLAPWVLSLAPSLKGSVFSPIDDCEHPLLYLSGTGIASQEFYQGPVSKILLAYAIVSGFGGFMWDGSPSGAVSGWPFLPGGYFVPS